jgi:uncharacterized repeat protein (TIGR03803 family)
MQCQKFSTGRTVILAMFVKMFLMMFMATTLMTATRAAAQTESVLHNFNFNNNGAGGTDPVSNLIFDAGGNLYGLTATGGDYGFGTAFELTPTATGWTETVLHSFQLAEGANPGTNGGLIFDKAGNLYGVGGGGAYGDGTVFELSPSSGGVWTITVLHDFSYGGTDGFSPTGSLTFDAAGNLYGTTGWGGTGPCTSEFDLVGCGTVFELSPQAGGGWSEKVLHSFGNGTDGTFPTAGLVFDAAGNLYGVTYEGGTGSCLRGGNAGCGTVFELTSKGDGHWDEKVLHNFTGTDGSWPVGSLVLDAAGNLYGMTNGGGRAGWGTAYELKHGPKGVWGEKILYSFSQNGSSGAAPYSGLIFDVAGNLYGTTSAYGKGGYGTAFKLAPTSTGRWTETTLHNFGSGRRDGNIPLDSLIFDATGNLYGTTSSGGSSVWGTVFQIKP